MSPPSRPDDHIAAEETGLPDPAGMVTVPSLDFPFGYRYGVTRYADLILRHAFPTRFADLTHVLEHFTIRAEEILSGGGGRASHTARFDASLEALGWGKRNITIEKRLDGQLLHRTRGHEIDMFGPGRESSEYPGVALEVEWNNKDPFFDRDLLNFQALHREGAIAIGVIVTRGPLLQQAISNTVVSSATSTSSKYGQSTTHWDKLIPRVNLGGGGECPLLLIGVEPARVEHFKPIQDAFESGSRIWKLPATP